MILAVLVFNALGEVRMSSVVLLVIYSLVCVAASLSGGWVPLVVGLTHRRMQIAISFVSGVMLGIGLLHLLPHSFEALQAIDYTMAWVLGGFLFMFFLERFFHFHHHDVGDEVMPPAPPQSERHEHTDHAHAHRARHNHDHAPSHASFSWIGAVVGLTLHGLIDGVAMAAAVMAEDGAVAWAGLGTFLAIALHKPFDSLTIGTLMAAAGRSTALRHLLNALYSLVTPLGVALCYLASARLGQSHEGLGEILGFAAGAFVCIATSDLLPELQFHRHDRATLSAALVAGIALAWGTVYLEGGHDHAHGAGHSHEADHQ
jgi:zinc and cadmium transporter